MRRYNIAQLHSGKEIVKELENVTCLGYDMNRVFCDWMDSIIFSLLALTDNMKRDNLFEKLKENKLDGCYEDSYKEVVGRYEENLTREQGKRPIDFFVSAWGKLVAETKDKQKDILGDIFQCTVSFGEHGQFFTPHHLSNAMAQMLDIKKKETILDPCCGSGRFLIDSSKENRDVILHGIDIDSRCVRMATINMWLFDLNAIIRQGNSLSNNFSEEFRVGHGGYLFHRKL